MSPTARTLARLRRLGFVAEPVERFIAGVGEGGRGIRRDWGHFADVLACHPRKQKILLVQSTTLPNLGARLAKARGRPELAIWLQAGGRFEVQGWTQRNGQWVVKVVAVQPGDMANVVLQLPPRKRPRSRWQPAKLF